MDKLAHAAEYAVLGFLLSGGFAQRRAWIPALLAGAVFGAGDELFQAVIPGRDSSLLDWAADVAGLLVGAATRRHVHR
jgi:VanZ family protein